MSTNCTLHPIDTKLAQALEASILGKRPHWDFFLHLYQKKSLIDTVNQPFKREILELLKPEHGLIIDLHLKGRPFLCESDEPSELTSLINQLYKANHEKDILKLLLKELQKLSEALYQEMLYFRFTKSKAPKLGLDSIIKDLQKLYRSGHQQNTALESTFILAQLSGLSQPYWFTGSYSLSFIQRLGVPGWDNDPEGIGPLFTTLPELAPFFPNHIERSLSTGIYLNHEEVGELLEIIYNEAETILKKMSLKQISEEVGFRALQKTTEALEYAKENHYGLLEAADIFDFDDYKYP